MTKLRETLEKAVKIPAFEKFRFRKLKAGSFHSDHYLRNTARRLEHLASLRIPVRGMTVLEVGAGVGDLSNYYLDRECSITITEARDRNLEYLKHRYPDADVRHLDVENPVRFENAPFDIVHCYGLLYHLGNPLAALKYLSDNCKKMLFISTCVSFGNSLEENFVKEDTKRSTQSYSGKGCRPTRDWIFGKLEELFEYVYVPLTQPNYGEFQLDWTQPNEQNISRAIFIGSREKMNNDLLCPSLIDVQRRHE